MANEQTKVIYDGVVLYADGSYMQRTGKIGAGIHGYAYSLAEPKKGAGADKDILTATGYVSKTEKDKVRQITPIEYIDIAFSTNEAGSNNTAEILAAAVGLESCMKYAGSRHDYQDIKITLYTDSMYVVDGFTKHAEGWIRKNWIKADGTEIKNRSSWERLIAADDYFSKVDFKWIKGHVGHLGNECADKLADIGRMKSEEGVFEIDARYSSPDGYWKKGIEKHPLLAQRATFFFTDEDEPKPGEYYLTNMVNTEEFIGTASSEMCVGVVQLKEADKTIEMVRARQKEFAMPFNAMILIRLDRLFTGSKADELAQYGKYCLSKGTRPGSIDLYFTGETSKNWDPVEGTPITEMLNPARLSHRISEQACKAQEILRNYLDKVEDENISVTDITSVFLKPGKKGMDFTDELKNENSVVRVELNIFDVTVQIPLTFNIHIINKNNIRKLSQNGSVSVKLVVVKENDLTLRYYTIVETQEEHSIWAGCHSNFIFHKALRAKDIKDTKSIKEVKE